jgi:hypothetical protein
MADAIKTEATLEVSRGAYIERVETLRQLAEAIKVQKGSQVKRLADATHTALGKDVEVDVPRIVFNMGVPKDDKVTVNLGDFAVWLEDVNSYAEQVATEQRDLILKEASQGNTLDALKAQYEQGLKTVIALATILNQTDPDKTIGLNVEDVELPDLRGARSSGTRRAGSKSATFYRIVDGVRKPQGDAQDNISSFAYWHGARLVGTPGKGSTNQGKGVPVDELEKFLRDNGHDSPRGKSWSIEQNGVTYGMDTVSDTSEEE